MTTNLTLGTTDIIVLVVLALLAVFAVSVVMGLFRL